VLAHEQPGAHEFIDGPAQGRAGDPERSAESALGGDRVAGASGLDELQQKFAYAFAFEHS
jgi:hypothetical protein